MVIFTWNDQNWQNGLMNLFDELIAIKTSKYFWTSFLKKKLKAPFHIDRHSVFLQPELSDPAGQMTECTFFFLHFHIRFIFET